MSDEVNELRKKLLDVRTKIAMINADHHDKYTLEEKETMISELKEEANNIRNEIKKHRLTEIEEERSK